MGVTTMKMISSTSMMSAMGITLGPPSGVRLVLVGHDRLLLGAAAQDEELMSSMEELSISTSKLPLYW